jgi:DNA-binding HxlR family transcriptional regulator
LRSAAFVEVSTGKPKRTRQLDCGHLPVLGPHGGSGTTDENRGKWTIFVVLSLDLLGGRARFSELERAVLGISQRMLSSTLKNLERDGRVIQELFPEVPPRVEYEMTGLGKSLLRPTQGLVDWAKENWEQVREAQSKYDAK